MPDDIALATPQAALTALAFEPLGDRCLLASWDGVSPLSLLPSPPSHLSLN